MELPAESANLAMLRRVASSLSGLEDELVLVGGCAVSVTIALTGHLRVRRTHDVDLVAVVASAREYQRLERRVVDRGYQPDPDVICRYRASSSAADVIDLMPSDRTILGFANRWYEYALEDWTWQDLGQGARLRVASVATLLATKLEARHSPDRGDLRSSRDMEDIVSLFDAVEELPLLVSRASPSVRRWVVDELDALLGDAGFVDAIGYHVPGDETSRRRIPKIIERMRETAELWTR